MSLTVRRVLDRFTALRALVVGDVLLDCYLDGTATRLCREGPAPVVRLDSSTCQPGGAANAAVNVAALGGRVQLLSAVGDDHDGQVLRDELGRLGVPAADVLCDGGRATVALHRVSASGQLLVRYDRGDGRPVGGAAAEQLVDRLGARFAEADVVIVSDYGHGTLTPTVVDELRRLQRQQPKVLVVDSKHPAAFRGLRPTAVKPNWDEALQLLGRGELDGTSERAGRIATEGDRILELTGAEIAAVSIDCDGAIVFERGRPPHRTFGRHEPVHRSVGAGDTFVAAFALALAAGADTPTAAEMASAASNVVVRRERTAACSAEDLRAAFAQSGKRLAGAAELAAVAERHRREGRRIVFTNGCFDLLHRGHITYLARAKTLGDVLVVGLNADDSVRRLKGQDRPITSLEDRAEVISALSSVDHVISFPEDTPSELIRVLRPDVYVKGGDRRLEEVPEVPVAREVGSEVRVVDYMEDRSTTGIIERIRSKAAPASAEAAR